MVRVVPRGSAEGEETDLIVAGKVARLLEDDVSRGAKTKTVKRNELLEVFGLDKVLVGRLSSDVQTEPGRVLVEVSLFEEYTDSKRTGRRVRKRLLDGQSGCWTDAELLRPEEGLCGAVLVEADLKETWLGRSYDKL